MGGLGVTQCCGCYCLLHSGYKACEGSLDLTSPEQVFGRDTIAYIVYAVDMGNVLEEYEERRSRFITGASISH